eukprot:TRINITY_DN11257_c0_g2_i3.p1 TRINITY_DN11257_c0_g2~~TRINITY_DN11257_c0_g2_i3.p1  ORF type:complete len:279 (+),score=45.49 TRINITY_DN11257_c0_g2_i3:55-891(+)
MSQQIEIFEADLGQLAVRTLQKPKVIVGISLWALGLYFCLYAAAPVAVTPEMEQAYFSALKAADNIPGLAQAEQDFFRAEAYLNDAKVWFWYFRPSYRAEVNRRQPEYDAAFARYEELHQQRLAMQQDARGKLGVFSDYAVGDTREQFWGLMGNTKSFAKRQTFWDALFSLGRRDESLVSYLVNLLIHFAINLIIGLVMSVIFFVFTVINIIRAYQASLLTGLLFFCCAMLGAASMVATYIFFIVGTLGGGAYLVARQNYLTARRQREQLGGRHPHSD